MIVQVLAESGVDRRYDGEDVGADSGGVVAQAAAGSGKGRIDRTEVVEVQRVVQPQHPDQGTQRVGTNVGALPQHRVTGAIANMVHRRPTG